MYSLAELCINTRAIQNNIEQINQMIGKSMSLIPVIKANFYGVGIDSILNLVNKTNASTVAVAHVCEAVRLRNMGCTKEILVLLQPSTELVYMSIERSFILSCGDIGFLKCCQEVAFAMKQQIKIHLELDIGMGRTGLGLSELLEFISELKGCPNVVLDGLFSHLPNNSNEIESFYQIEEFRKAYRVLSENSLIPHYVHLAATGGVLRYLQQLEFTNAVRCGLSILGYFPDSSDHSIVSLKPSLQLKTKFVSCKWYEENTKIGYNRYCFNRSSRIGVLPIGFADILIGYDAPGGYVVINNQLAPVVSICMDSIMVDITDVKDVEIGTEAYIWDNTLVTLNDWATWCKSSIYEVIALMSDRISRVEVNV